ncbi:DUF4394 domain-containing protein [Streptomyces sp. NPDC059513]|uniref:DUF4394 domain-containing protein n=1 Tax=unclassified Streptomyces TaxID=2593676 RepID=UPI00367AFB81
MRTRRTVVAVSVSVLAALSAPALASADGHGGPRTGHRGHQALTAVGLTADQRLVAFPVDRPAGTSAIGKVSGLRGDTRVVGIDFRVQDGKLYGVGDQGGVYTLGTADARAVKVSQLTVALSGGHFGVDFNPAADRLRVISDTGQNPRHNIDDGTAPLGTTADGTLAPAGNLGVDAGPDAGFDISFSPEHGTNQGFATLGTGGAARLYAVDVLTGAARDLGALPRRQQVTDLALPLDQQR